MDFKAFEASTSGIRAKSNSKHVLQTYLLTNEGAGCSHRDLAGGGGHGCGSHAQCALPRPTTSGCAWGPALGRLRVGISTPPSRVVDAALVMRVARPWEALCHLLRKQVPAHSGLHGGLLAGDACKVVIPKVGLCLAALLGNSCSVVGHAGLTAAGERA
eukprot:366490-Chlamydomonas_euryale.AAC.44